MDKLSADELRKTVESLVQATKCAVCLNVLQLDTVTCVQGHVICLGCRRTQTCCPTCRKVFSNVENSAFIRQVLEVIPHTCSHKGCPDVVYRGDEHEKYCKYRYEQCKFSGCTWQGYVKDLGDHCRSKHSEYSFSSGATDTTLNGFHTKKEYSYKIFTNPLGHLFFKEVQYSPSTAILTFMVFPIMTEKPKSDFFFEVEFKSVEKRVTFTTKLDIGKEENTPVSKNIIHVPTSIFQQFWDEKEKKLKFIRRITNHKTW